MRSLDIFLAVNLTPSKTLTAECIYRRTGPSFVAIPLYDRLAFVLGAQHSRVISVKWKQPKRRNSGSNEETVSPQTSLLYSLIRSTTGASNLSSGARRPFSSTVAH